MPRWIYNIQWHTMTVWIILKYFECPHLSPVVCTGHGDAQLYGCGRPLGVIGEPPGCDHRLQLWWRHCPAVGPCCCCCCGGCCCYCCCPLWWGAVGICKEECHHLGMAIYYTFCFNILMICYQIYPHDNHYMRTRYSEGAALLHWHSRLWNQD